MIVKRAGSVTAVTGRVPFIVPTVLIIRMEYVQVVSPAGTDRLVIQDAARTADPEATADILTVIKPQALVRMAALMERMGPIVTFLVTLIVNLRIVTGSQGIV